MDDCVQSGVVGSLCGAAKGAADLLMATDEVGGQDVPGKPCRQEGSRDRVGLRRGGRHRDSPPR